jgi:hypothetical protein
MLNENKVRLLRKYLPNSALFDLIMFCLFAGLLPFVQPLLDSEIVYTIPDNKRYLSWRIGIIFLAAVAAQIIGFWLKRKRIAQAYNHQQKNREQSYPLIGSIFIALMHLIIFGVWLVNDGINYINDQGTWWLVVIKVILILLPTVTGLIVVGYATRHHEIDRLGAISTASDLIGTILLSLSSFVAVASLWSLLLGNINLNLHDGKIFINAVLTLLYFLAFLLLYLPTRWAFLMMDYRQPYTWLRMAVVFLPFLKGLWMGYAFFKFWFFR